MKLRFVLFVVLMLAINVIVFAQKAESKTEPLQVGAIAPDFALSSNKDKKITLSEVNKLTILVFYRGYW